MRIGMITGEYPPMEGGVGAFTEELSRALRDLGHQLHILTTCTDAAGENTVEAGLTIHRRICQWDTSGIRQAYAWVQALPLDVVNLQYEPAAYGLRGAVTFLPRRLQRRQHPPLVITFHDLLPPYLFPKAGSLRQWSVRQMARRADGCIATNREDQQALVAFLETAKPKVPTTRLIPIGSNIATQLPESYNRVQTRAHYGFTPGDLVVGFFGFMNRSKGIDTLLEAIAILRDMQTPIRLLLIGGRTGASDASNIRYADEVDGMIRELNLDPFIVRTGFAAQDEISAALHAIDICALPYRDGANLRRGTLHAALVHGCAIITTTPRVPVAGLKQGVGAWLVPPEMPQALADAIRQLWAAPQLRRQLSAGATTLAGRFSWPNIAAETADFYRTLK